MMGRTDKARAYEKADEAEERERVRDEIESEAHEYILDRVESMEALQEQADEIEERLRENEEDVMDNFYQMMEEDPETYAALRQAYGHDETPKDIERKADTVSD